MVVSLTNVSPAHAQHYYMGNVAQSLTSTKGPTAVSVWQGKLAQALALSGTVQPADFEHLLSGKTPAGDVLIDKFRLHQQQNNAKATGKTPPTERAAIDLTTSAPKAVSLQALVFGDTRLEAAHQRANAVMVQVLEERYARTRITTGGKRQVVKTGALAIASFHHDTSRALDPQLHTHNVVLNLQRHPQTGRWQTLDNTAIFNAKILLGQIYRNELACAVQDLGYRIRLTGQPHGLWELEGFAPPQLKAFSTRSQQIAAVTGAAASPQAQLRAVQLTRPEKQELPRFELLERWQSQVSAMQMQPLVSTPFVSAVAQPGDAGLRLQTLVAQQEQSRGRADIEKLVLQSPGQMPFAKLQQILDNHMLLPTLNPVAVSQGQYTHTGAIDDAFPRTESPPRSDAESPLTTTDLSGTTGRSASLTTTQSTSNANRSIAYTHVSESHSATTGSSPTSGNPSHPTSGFEAIARAVTQRTDSSLDGHGTTSPSDSQTRRSANRATGEADITDPLAFAHQPDHAQAVGGRDDQTLRYPDAFAQLAAEFRHLAAVFGTAEPTEETGYDPGTSAPDHRATEADQSDSTQSESPTEDTAPERSPQPSFNVRSQRAESSLVDDSAWEDELELR